MQNLIHEVYISLMNGRLDLLTEKFCVDLSKYAVYLIDKQHVWDSNEVTCVDEIIRISNICYNNTSCVVLPLDDGIYDQLLVILQKYISNYSVGAKPIIFDEVVDNEKEEKKIMAYSLSKEAIDSKLYCSNILQQHTRIGYEGKYRTMAGVVRNISKRIINTPHKYPELVGTLDKCKFVLNNDAIEQGVFDKPSVQVFERDFMQKHLFMQIINPVIIYQMLGELKYDGVSVEADVCGDTIVSARSRGDTAEDIATDLTPIFGGYKFKNAANVPKDITFGIKFEAVINKYDMQKLADERGKSYKNCRNCIIGLLSSSDAHRYVDYITLIPLATSLDIDRITELKFLNKYYNSGEYNRYVVFEGDYTSLLFQIKQFTESAEIVRKVLPYLIDGVVISYIDKNIINALGRDNSVNKYQMAIKFNPKKVRTKFLGYTYNIGKTGDITPMAHFKPCEFIGTIHDKQTIHSYARFKALNLRLYDEIDIEYRNEVICYVTKPDTEFNRNNAINKPEKFIETCPCCGGKIVISESKKSARCVNPLCKEKLMMRMVDMIDILGFRDFSEETIRTLSLTSFKQLMNLDLNAVRILGENNSVNFITQLKAIKENQIADYVIMTAMCFDNIALEKWKIILNEVDINFIVNSSYQDLYSKLISIKSIGDTIIKTIFSNREIYKEDLEMVLSMGNIINTQGMNNKPKIAISGFRNREFEEILRGLGYECGDTIGVTRNTVALIVKDKNSSSSKITKAKQYGIPIKTMQEFISENNIKI